MKKILWIFALIFVFATAVSSITMPVLEMATTTSTDNTGLLDYLAPLFAQQTGIELQWVAVGSGAAIKHGENGDVDVILTHDPAAEDKFETSGAGVNRKFVMFNDFVIIGPKDDPAKIKGSSAVDAMKKISETKSIFVSRDDESGTHSAERKLWERAGITTTDKASWHIAIGQGMLQTINVAAERDGYTLADRGTFIAYESKGGDLVILVEGDDSLKNQYSVMAVNPKNHPNAKYELAKKFIDWIISAEGQSAIENFKLEGKQLFFPNAKEKNK